MDVRLPAVLLWRGPVLAAAAWMLTACATEMGELQPPPATPVVAAPAPAAPAPGGPARATAPGGGQPAASAARGRFPRRRSRHPPRRPRWPRPRRRPRWWPARRLRRPAVVPAPAPVAAPARGTIEVTGVEMQESGSNGVVVLVSGDGPIPTYESFALPDPPRLVVDIPNAVHAIRSRSPRGPRW